jgi:hypothetical protein
MACLVILKVMSTVYNSVILANISIKEDIVSIKFLQLLIVLEIHVQIVQQCVLHVKGLSRIANSVK